jgi:chemosensory pili system protein ChpA (sensor histidine kinase/response regulator)
MFLNCQSFSQMAIDKSDYKRVFATVFTSAEELVVNAKSQQNALKQYLENWTEIAEKATEVNNLALQDVILLFIDASSSSFKKIPHPDDLTETQWQFLKKWDNSFANYINNPSDQQAALTLIQCLNDPLLAMGLEHNDEIMLLDSFIPVIRQLTDNSKPVADKATAAIAESVSVWQKLIISFKKAYLNLQELCDKQNNSSPESCNEILKHYLTNWKTIAQIINTENNDNLEILLEIITLFINFNVQLFDQFTHLTNEQQKLLKQWHNLFGHYLKAHGSQQITLSLIECLSNPLWPQPLSRHDAKILLTKKASVKLPAVNSAPDSPIIEQAQSSASLINNVQSTPSATDNTIAVWQKISKPFVHAVLSLKAMASEQNEQSFALQVQQYQQLWQQIAQIIETDGQAGLLDVVLLFGEISSPAFTTAKLSSQHLARLKKWHSLFDNYVKGRGDEQFILPLIKCLGDLIWPDAITAEDEKMLLQGFGEAEKAASLASAVKQSNIVLPFPKPDPVTTTNIAEATQLTPTHTNREQAIESRLEQLFRQTAVNLQAIINHQLVNDTAASKLSLQNYLESWLAIARNIEVSNQQSGLLDVVLLFIEVTRQAFMQSSFLDKKQIAVLNKWQDSFSSYLKTQDNQEIARLLIECLSDPVWSGAITPEDEKMLLAGFSATPQEQDQIEPAVEITFDEELEPATEIVFPEDESEPAVEITFDEELEPATEIVFPEDETQLDEDSNLLQFIDETEQAITYNVSVGIEQGQSGIWQEIETVFNQAAAALKAAIDNEIVNNTHAFKLNLQNYVQSWQAICDIIAVDEALFGLLDIAMLFTELANQAFADLTHLSSEQFSLLNKWQNLFAAYFKTPNNQALALELIQCLGNPLWPQAIAAEDEEMLLIGLNISESSQLPAMVANEPELIIDATVEQAIEKNPLWQKFAVFFADTLPQIQAMEALLAANNPQPCREHLQQYAEHWLVIAEIIAEQDDISPVFIDVCELFADNCMEFIEQAITLTQNHIQLLRSWQTSFTAYVEQPASLPLLGELIACLAQSGWLRPVTEEDKTLLLELAAESQHSSLFAEETANLLFNPDLTSKVQGNEGEEQLLTMFVAEAEFDEETLLAAQPVELTQEEGLFSEPVVVKPELVGMVRDEFALLAKELADEIAQAHDAAEFKEVLKNHEFKFENLATACHTIGLIGLQQVFVHLSLNMRSRRGGDTFSAAESELFKTVLPLIQNYLVDVGNSDKSIGLVAHLCMPGWKQPLDESQMKSFLDLLSGLVIGTKNKQQNDRKTTAELADVSLVLPNDVNRDLLDSLLDELPTLTGKFSAVIQQIISGKAEVQQLLDAQRIAHTLKGSGNIVGVAGIAVLTHHLEEILEYLTEHKTFPTKGLAQVLLESADCLEMMSDLMLNSEHHPPEQALSVLQNVLNWANQIANDGLPSEDSNLENTTTLPAQPDIDITPVVQEKATEAMAMTRVSSEVIDKLLRMTGEGSILSEQFKERVKRFSNELKNLNELTWHIQSLVSELDQSINIQSYSTKTSRGVVNDEFDALEMEQYNELHTAASRIAEVATDIREVNIQMEEQLVDLKYLMMEEDSIQKENQDMVQSIRMVPASNISSRCQRIVRQACRATNKEVDLEIKGADLLIDSEILNDMVEPLMHLLRNSIDHGIEPLHIREKNNKSPTGKITLEFSRKGNYAVISCKDDGGGLASGNILQTAIKKGLISAKQQLTDAEIHKLILIPGFSTRTVVTQTSGRGIGMDAIQTKISSMQGQMSLFSERGKGLAIEITIPLTLSSMLSLLVKCGGQTMAISNRGLRKIHHADECILSKENSQLRCEINGQSYPAKYFSELVGMSTSYEIAKKLPALRIEDEIGRTHIVLVDELLGYRDLLVKNMGSYIPHIQGVTGASILGNGDVAPVIDLVEMLHHSAKYNYLLPEATKALADSINGLPVALVVDDSLSARRAVAILLKDSGIAVETAIDGLDAIKHIEKAVPDLIVVDLEMPRMNGIELTAHVRNREAMKDTPIIMITSRATEKHRKQAEAAGVTKFMTKPFTEDDLVHNVRMLMK